MSMDPSEVARTIKAAKSAPIGFAFGAGSTPAASVLFAERGKSGDQLVSQVKKQDGVKQSCGGTVQWNGSSAVFAADKPLSGLEKLLEGWARAHKVSLKFDVTTTRELEKEQAESEAEEDDPKSPFSKEEISVRLRQSRSKTMYFAFGHGSAQSGDLVAMHPIKNGEKLFRLIKQENGASKRCWGTVELQGAMAVFTCEGKPISGMTRCLRAMFKEWKLPFRISVMGAGSEDKEDEGEETPGGAPSREVAALRNDLTKLKPKVQALARATPADAKTLRDAYTACEKALDTGDMTKAKAAFRQLEELAKGG